MAMRTLNRTIPYQDTVVYAWFERDRSHVELRHRRNDDTIVEWWDDEVHEAIMDGFLDPHDWHGSAWAFARYIGAC